VWEKGSRGVAAEFTCRPAASSSDSEEPETAERWLVDQLLDNTIPSTSREIRPKMSMTEMVRKRMTAVCSF
jgi:hypothetical protein